MVVSFRVDVNDSRWHRYGKGEEGDPEGEKGESARVVGEVAGGSNEVHKCKQ